MRFGILRDRIRASTSAEIEDRLALAGPRLPTTLLQGVQLAIDELSSVRDWRTAIVIVSDSPTRSSGHTQNEAAAVTASTDALIYALAPIESNEPLLGWLANQTGGAHVVLGGISDAAEETIRIGIGLRTLYVLGFESTVANQDRRYRQLAVELRAPRGVGSLASRHRAGY